MLYEVITTKKGSGKRKEIKALVEHLDDIYSEASKSLFASMNNVNLNTIIGYKKNNTSYCFLDEYDK